MKCIRTGEICKTNLTCKECKLTDCRNVLIMIEEDEAMYIERQEQKFVKELKRQFPSCVNCSHLEILNLEKGKVRCPYMINKRCAIK